MYTLKCTLGSTGKALIMKNKSENLFKIGEIAKIAEITVPTLRYYEEIGVLKSSKRSNTNYRYYKKSDIEIITFIKKAQSIGFTLKEIKLVISERVKGKSPCPKVRELAKRKVEEINQKISELKRMEKDLIKYIVCCDGLDCCEKNSKNSKLDVSEVCNLLDKIKI